MSCLSCKFMLSIALAALLVAFVAFLIGTGGTGAAAAAGAAEGGALVTAIATKLAIDIAAAKALVAGIGGLIWAGASISGILGWLCCKMKVTDCC